MMTDVLRACVMSVVRGAGAVGARCGAFGKCRGLLEGQEQCCGLLLPCPRTPKLAVGAA